MLTTMFNPALFFEGTPETVRVETTELSSGISAAVLFWNTLCSSAIHWARCSVIGQKASVVVACEKLRKACPLLASDAVTMGAVGPDTESSICCIELHPEELLSTVAPPIVSIGGPSGQPK